MVVAWNTPFPLFLSRREQRLAYQLRVSLSQKENHDAQKFHRCLVVQIWAGVGGLWTHIRLCISLSRNGSNHSWNINRTLDGHQTRRFTSIDFFISDLICMEFWLFLSSFSSNSDWQGSVPVRWLVYCRHCHAGIGKYRVFIYPCTLYQHSRPSCCLDMWIAENYHQLLWEIDNCDSL